MSGAGRSRSACYCRDRGNRFEWEFVRFMREGEVPARRHFMSGRFEKGDCTLTPGGLAEPLVGQLKRRRALPRWLGLDGHDFVAVREDRGRTLILCDAELFRRLLK